MVGEKKKRYWKVAATFPFDAFSCREEPVLFHFFFGSAFSIGIGMGAIVSECMNGDGDECMWEPSNRKVLLVPNSKILFKSKFVRESSRI